MSTQYVVLQKTSDEAGDWDGWAEAGQIEARSAQDAVSAYVKANGSKPGTYLAVPLRSWHPITVSVETQTRLKLT